MKNKISFFVIMMAAFGINCANASECVGEGCDLIPELIEEYQTVDVLEPESYEIDWMEQSVEDQTCEYDYECPFETEAECEAWYKKPAYKTDVMLQTPHINPIQTDDLLYAIYANYDIDANDPQMAPLLERYQMLMNASRACCGAGITYKMRTNGAKDEAVYKFLKDDANYFAVMSRCMVMNDDEISNKYSNGVTGQMVADVRNACLCKNRKWFETLLQPFFDIYERAPQFEERPFLYTRIDGLQREITVSVNEDVHTTAGLLSVCPD